MDGFLTWTPELSVGIDILDGDHQGFFELAAVLHDAQQADPVERHMVALSAIGLLEEYVEGHFLREERAMEKAGYPGLARHRELHQAFREQVAATARSYKEGDTAAAESLAQLVVSWLSAHIANVDHDYMGTVKPSDVDASSLMLLVLAASEEEVDEE
jgi:hemerythrin